MRLIPSALVGCITMAAVTLAPSPAMAEDHFLSDLSVISATFDPKTGRGFVEVSVACAEEIYAVEFWATMTQGRTSHSYDNWGDCVDGVATTTISVSDDQEGRFRGGPATINVSAYGYCDRDYPVYCMDTDL